MRLTDRNENEPMSKIRVEDSLNNEMVERSFNDDSSKNKRRSLFETEIEWIIIENSTLSKQRDVEIM